MVGIQEDISMGLASELLLPSSTTEQRTSEQGLDFNRKVNLTLDQSGVVNFHLKLVASSRLSKMNRQMGEN